jgi:hypothetical protein
MRLRTPTSPPIARFGDWSLYELPRRERDSFLWRKFKLQCDRPKKRGTYRVYRLSWNLAESRFAKDAILVRLEALQPDLFRLVGMHLDLSYGPDAIGMSPAAIAAERARLKAARKARTV